VRFEREREMREGGREEEQMVGSGLMHADEMGLRWLV